MSLAKNSLIGFKSGEYAIYISRTLRPCMMNAGAGILIKLVSIYTARRKVCRWEELPDWM